jgi:hypothetical protein
VEEREDSARLNCPIGGYLSKDAALEEYESVLGCGGYLHGAVVVTKDLEGELDVQQTDHMVRGGADGRGAVGFAMGMFVPPLLAATAIGTVIGSGTGKAPPSSRRPRSCRSRLGPRSRYGRRADRGLPTGSVEPAVTRAVTRVVGEAEGHHVQALKGAIADAQAKLAASQG